MSASSNSDVVVIESVDIEDYNDGQILPLSEDQQARIRTWLKPTPYDAEHGEYKKHLASHLSSTGHWLRESSSFKKWYDEDGGLLWIKGIPGSGKSVMAASLIRHLASEGVPVLFFFFRQIIDANHGPINLLRDWLCQLLIYSPPLQVQLQGLIKEGRDLESMSIDKLWEELEHTVAAMKKVYLVVDALDEMDQDNDAFLTRLAALGNQSPSSKVIITSRPIASVESVFRQVPKTQIRLDHQLVDDDIAAYVTSRLATSSIPGHQHDMIRQAVPGRASGLFLYAKLAMDAFVRDGANVDEAMEKLPGDLNAIYEGLLRDHAQRSGVPDSMQLHILSWVTHAARPLRLLELAAAVQGVDQTTDIGSTKELVRAACGPLIEILPDETVSVIHHSLTEFLKGTTRDASTQPGSYPVLDMGSTHTQLAKTCVSYMLQPGILGGKQDDNGNHDTESDSRVRSRYRNYDPSKPLEKAASRYPFAKYCFQYVCHHLGTAEEYSDVIDKNILDLLGEMLTDRRIAALDRLGGGYWKHQTPIHVLSRWGLAKYLSLYLEQGVGGGKDVIDAFDIDRNTPLLDAAHFGHARVVATLIEHGANPNKESDRTGYKPLHEAAMNNHGRAVDILLRAGVPLLTRKTREDEEASRISREGTIGHTALMYAMKQGHRAAAAAFLRHIDDDDTNTIRRALAWAAEGGDADVVRQVLGHAAVRVNDTIRGDTPLFLALKGHWIRAAIALLEAGADPSIMSVWAVDEFSDASDDYQRRDRVAEGLPRLGNTGFNALHALCGTTASRRDLWMLGGGRFGLIDERLRCMRLILETGIDVNVPDEYGETPLRLASRWSPHFVKLLLDVSGDNINAELADRGTCLHLAEDPETVRLLVKGKADVNKRRKSDSLTPLLLAVRHANYALIMTLLELGADAQSRDTKGRSALHIYIQYVESNNHSKDRRKDIIKALIAAGVSPNAKDKDGNTPLHDIDKVVRLEEILRSLVFAGADINARNNKGYALIHKLAVTAADGSEWDTTHRLNKQVVEILASLDANLDIRDPQGCNVLSQCLRRSVVDTDTVNALILHGADPQALDYAGNSLWHRIFIDSKDLLERGQLEVLQSLGVDVSMRNDLGQTALHFLAARQPSDLEMGVHLGLFEVDAKDYAGIRPLHVAVRESESGTSLLIDAGASLTEATYEGLTPLHVAARFRQPNIVGILLEELHDRYDEAEVKSHLNVTSGPSALHLACRSGVPETVALLLAAGSDPNLVDDKGLSPLLYCTQYEDEETLWKASPSPSKVSSSVSDTFGLLLNDTHRLPPQKRQHATRLEEIMTMLHTYGAEMLYAYGAELPAHGADRWQRTRKPQRQDATTIHSAIAGSGGKDYTITCLLNLKYRLTAHLYGTNTDTNREPGEGVNTKDGLQGYITPSWSVESQDMEYSLLASVYRRKSSLKAFSESKPWSGADSLMRWSLDELINGHEWDVIQHWFDNDPRCFTKRKDDNKDKYWYYNDPRLPKDENTQLTRLINAGLDVLVGRVLTSEKAHELEQQHDGITTQNGHEAMEPLLHYACRRSQGNMPMLRRLVETVGVDIDRQNVVKTYISKYEEGPRVRDESALHILASGTSWWQSAEGIPYLIAHNASLELKDQLGRTPLLCAVARGGSTGRRAARILIQAGANVNAVDDSGQSCLSLAANDPSMVELLMDSGQVQVTASAVFSAIENQNAHILDILCQKISPDVRRPYIEQSTSAQERWHRHPSVYARDMYPLYYAAQAVLRVYLHSRSGLNDTRDQVLERFLPCVTVLVQRGASLFVTYTAERMTDQEPETVETTLLHDLIEKGSLITPIFEHLTMDIETRDSQGRTLLLSACRRYPYDPDASIDALQVGVIHFFDLKYKAAYPTKHPFTGKPSLVDMLLDRGADVTVQDNDGKNCLHHILQVAPRGGLVSLRRLLSMSPELVHQVTTEGESPLHYAFRRCVDISESNDVGPDFEAIEMLLDAGADLHLPDKDGNSAFHVLVKWLSTINHDELDEEEQDQDVGETRTRLFHLFKRFASLGLPINGRNTRGETPLFHFIAYLYTVDKRPYMKGDNKSQEAALKLLSSLGADFHTTDYKGDTLFHLIAATTKTLQVVGYQAVEGEETGEGIIKTFRWLLDQGLDPMRVNKRNQTCLDVASIKDNRAILEMFQE